MSQLSPSELIFERNSAFARSDFGFIFDSYHPDSGFRRQFHDRNEYIQYGQSSLGPEYTIDKCQILAERSAGSEKQLICLMEITNQGVPVLYAELAWFRQEDGQWLYHRSQKMTADELPQNPEALDFADFEKLDPGTIF
jgi:SEC-C motif-containing protein